MNRQTLTIVVLGLSLTIGAGLFIGGCQIMKHWYSLFALIPALLAIVAVYGIQSTAASDAVQGLISFDTWVFLLVFCLVAVLGIPVTIYHTRGLAAAGGIALNVIGSVVIFTGFALTWILPTCGGDDGWTQAY
jgi:hypothetical protein